MMTILIQTLIDVLTPLVAPGVVWLIKKTWDRIPSWIIPIIAVLVGASGNMIATMLVNSTNTNALKATLLGFAAIGMRELQNQIAKRIKEGPRPPNDPPSPPAPVRPPPTTLDVSFPPGTIPGPNLGPVPTPPPPAPNALTAADLISWTPSKDRTALESMSLADIASMPDDDKVSIALEERRATRRAINLRPDPRFTPGAIVSLLSFVLVSFGLYTVFAAGASRTLEAIENQVWLSSSTASRIKLPSNAAAPAQETGWARALKTEIRQNDWLHELAWGRISRNRRR